MTERTASRQRTYAGYAFFSGGFRPFFLFGALWAAIAMVLWLFMLAGRLSLPSAFAPLDWHIHELLFGYGAAAICGFLLTAVPNWTGRLPVTGAPLAGLLVVWLAGRAAVGWGGALPPALVAVIDLAFPALLSLIVGREILSGGNRRNLPVLGLSVVFLAGNVLFHLGAARGWPGGPDLGTRTGIAALVMLLALIGGRIVPSFTRNWLVQHRPGRLPAPFGRYDTICLGATACALLIWIVWPQSGPASVAMLLTGVLHIGRLGRWAGWRTLPEPMVAVLHAGYGFLPLGFLLLGAAAGETGPFAAAGTHAWTTGAVGLMTLAVMTRATRGHTGRALSAGIADMAIYLLIALAALLRIGAALTIAPSWLLTVAASAWIAGYTLFVIVYGPALTRPRLAAKRPGKAPPA